MRRFDEVFDVLLNTLASLAAIIFALIAILIPVNVALRNAFDSSIYGLLDAIEYGLLAATFLAAPWVLSLNAHVSVDLLVEALPKGLRSVIDAIANGVGLLATSVFLWFAIEALAQSVARGSMIRTAFVLPEWWVLSIAPVSAILILIEFLRRLVRPRSRAIRAVGL